MKIMLAVVMLSLPLLGTGMAYGNESDDKRQDCNKQAEGLSGGDRHRAISSCIRRNAGVRNMPPMLGKITECNKKAGDMKGDARVKFVDKCMQTP